jgi:hypothetical protein
MVPHGNGFNALDMLLAAMINRSVGDNCGIGRLWGGTRVCLLCVSYPWRRCTRFDIDNDAWMGPMNSHVVREVPTFVVFLVSHGQ